MTRQPTDANPVWQVDHDTAVVDGADAVTVLDLAADDPTPLVLSATAAQIWNAIDGRRTTNEIVASVAGSYGLAGNEVRDDVISFLNRLQLAGVIRQQPQATD